MMETVQQIRTPLILLIALVVSGCIATQLPAPIIEGTINANSDSSIEPQSSTEPYHPSEGAVLSLPNATTPENNPLKESDYIASYKPVVMSAREHHVVAGDTVYTIAKRYSISQDDLRTWNNINDDIISVHQILLVKNPAISGDLIQTTDTTQMTSTPKTPLVHNANVRRVDGIEWIQPIQGQLATFFSKITKGIEIIGLSGSPILAVADGKVIYSGTLDGYGNLIIIQHTTKYFTAYGNNQANFVKEGDLVRQGQKIATMGDTGANRVQLHFELRRDGQPIDPLDYIPTY